MHYIIQILAAMLIGTAIGTMLSPRNPVLFAGTIIAIVLGVATLVTASWIPLALGTAVFIVVHAMQRDNKSSANT